MLHPEKSKNIIFFTLGHENIYNDVVQPVRALEHLKCLFPTKMTKIPLVNLEFDRMSNEVKTLTKQHFSWFYIKPELLGDF